MELCHVLTSQEERLRHCSFAPRPDECFDHDANEDSDDSTQPLEVEVKATPIVMVSLLETPEEEEKKDNSTPQDLFQTPTEGSLLANSEEQQPPVDTDDPAVDEPRAPEPNCTDGDKVVDLGKDTDLGFPYGDTVIVDSESEEDDWEEGEEKNQEKLREKANGSERYRMPP